MMLSIVDCFLTKLQYTQRRLLEPYNTICAACCPCSLIEKNGYFSHFRLKLPQPRHTKINPKWKISPHKVPSVITQNNKPPLLLGGLLVYMCQASSCIVMIILIIIPSEEQHKSTYPPPMEKLLLPC